MRAPRIPGNLHTGEGFYINIFFRMGSGSALKLAYHFYYFYNICSTKFNICGIQQSCKPLTLHPKQ